MKWQGVLTNTIPSMITFNWWLELEDSKIFLLTEHVHDQNDPMALIQEDPELFVRPKLDDGKQKSCYAYGMRSTEEVPSRDTPIYGLDGYVPPGAALL